METNKNIIEKKKKKCVCVCVCAELIDEEKNLATKAGKLHLHLQKWECLHNLINEPA